MARPPAGAGRPASFPDLRTRLVPALGAGLVAVAFVWLGGIWLALAAAAAVVVMVLEWRRITAGTGGRVQGAPYAAAAAGSVVLSALAPFWVAAAVLIGGAAAAMALDLGRGRRAAGLWSLAGALYIGAAGIALVALRGFEPFGLLTIVWVVLVVIATDVGGYFAGRMIGGPKLWRRVSPNKTWAGTIGGIVLAALVGGLFDWVALGDDYLQICALSAIAAMVSQAGDLAESALKRRFGVKDSGTIMPGHGGLLDRLDGQIPAILIAALVTFARGQAVFVW